MKKIINNFIYYLEFKKNKKYNTIISVKTDLNRFYQYFYEKNVDLEKIDVFLMREYFNFLKKEKLSNSTFNRNLSTIKSFFAYLIENKIIEKNPVMDIENLDIEKSEIIYLTEEEIEKIRKAISLEKINFNSIRDRFIFELLYSSGMTVAELLSLGELNFNVEKNEIDILKDNERKKVYFSNTAKKFYKKLLEVKKEKFGEKNKPNIIFVNNSNTRLGDRSLRRIIAKYGVKAGLEKEISPYMLRHTFCVHMLKNGMPKLYLKKLLGLKSKNVEILDNYDKIIK